MRLKLIPVIFLASGALFLGVFAAHGGTKGDAVKTSSVVWNEAVLDKWLTDPEAVIPDSDMAFRLDNPAERAAIIAFLKETSK